MKKIPNESGFTLVEVLASIVIITIILTAVSTSFINNVNSNRILNEKYSATQLCESLLTVYKEKGYADLVNEISVGTSEEIDIVNELQLDPSSDAAKYKANVTRLAPPQSIETDVVMIQVSVHAEGATPTILKGYVRK